MKSNNPFKASIFLLSFIFIGLTSGQAYSQYQLNSGYNIVLSGTDPRALEVERLGTFGSYTNPKFSFFPIELGGDGSPNSTIYFGNRKIFALDNKGIFASIQYDRLGSSFEAYKNPNDSEPYFRIRSDDGEGLSLGDGGSIENDVKFKRSGTKKAGIEIDGMMELEATEEGAFVKNNGTMNLPILTSHPSSPPTGWIRLYGYWDGSATLPYYKLPNGTTGSM